MQRDTLIEENNKLKQPLSASSEAIASTLPALSDKAKTLLLAASEDKVGSINIIKHSTGQFIKVGNKDFGEDNNPRSEAEWEAAIEELESLGYIKLKSEDYYTVTSIGFAIGDQFRRVA